MSSNSRLALAFTVIFLAVSLLWLSQSGTPARHRPTPPPVAEDTPTTPSPRPTRAPKPFSRAVSERIDVEEIWDIDLAVQPLAITLALDEAVLRDADGKETITRLAPPATQETLPARLAELSAPLGVFPVAYLVGEDRSTAIRRIVTPDLRVQLESATAESHRHPHRYHR